MNPIKELIQTGTAAEIRETLDFLLNECTADDTPDRETVCGWREILVQRGGKFSKIANNLCNTFLQETARERDEK